MYQVLARKFRPRNFDELVGQDHVARTLSNAIVRGRWAHAYLFAGQRGTGKTTVARILAKCLNCERGPTVDPCDECDPCREIAASRALDVLEIDAASRTKVEQTRELMEMVSYAPVRDRHKILIVDEVHMLSSASFNALLKTLEEPPPNVVFVLATTEMQKILPTILSRCQVFEFRRIGVDELAAHLRRVCDAESVEISTPALERVARAGEGSVRDSLSVLERIVAFCGNQVDDGEVLRALGGVRFELLEALTRGLARRDAAAMLGILDRLVDEGHDLLHFWNELVGVVRDLLLMRAVRDPGTMLSRPREEAEALRSAATELGLEDLNRAFQILADLEPLLKGSARPRFMFESALIRLASLGSVRPIEELLRELGGADASRGDTSGQERPRGGTIPGAKTAESEAGPRSAPSRAGAAAAPESIEAQLVRAVLDDRPMLGTILQQASAVELAGDRIEIRFPAGTESLTRPLQRKENLAELEKHAARLTGRRVTVIVLGAGDVRRPAGPRPARAADAFPARDETPPVPPGPTASLIERATSEPGVRKLLRDFGAQVLDIRPLETVDGAAPDASAAGPTEDAS